LQKLKKDFSIFNSAGRTFHHIFDYDAPEVGIKCFRRKRLPYELKVMFFDFDNIVDVPSQPGNLWVAIER